MKIFSRYITAVFTAFALFCQNADAQPDCLTLKPAIDSINSYLSQKASVGKTVKIDTFFIDRHSIKVHLNKTISDYPLRDRDLKFMEDAVRSSLSGRGSGLKVEFTYGGKPLKRLISGYYSGYKADGFTKEHKSWIKKIDSPIDITKGLDGCNIALWSSHGYYYSHEAGRWEWQRAPFFTTVEDLLTHWC